MKKTFFLFIAIALSQYLFAAESTVKVFTVDGIKVILKPTAKDVISARLFVKGGTANYTKAQEGIESLTLNMLLEGGTTTKNKVQFHTDAERMGSEFHASTSYDYGEVNMTCVKMFWNESWALFADAILNPAFDEKEFGQLKEQLVTGAKQTETNPDAHLRNLAMQHAYEGRNYGKVPDGTFASLEKLTLADVKAYYKKVVVKNKCFIVVVGNVTQEEVTQKIKSGLAKMPLGTAVTVEPRKLITEPGIFVEDRDIATNYIRGMMSAPTMGSPDGIPMRLAMSIMRDHFFVELRTKRSLTYAPQAAYSSSIVNDPYNIIYVSTQKPKEALEVMIDIINKFKAEGFSEKELTDQKEQTITQYYMGLQTASDQSYNLGMAEMWGDIKIADTYYDRVKSTTLKDINRVLDKYTNAIRWTYLGKKDDVQKEDFKQAKENKYKPY